MGAKKVTAFDTYFEKEAKGAARCEDKYKNGDIKRYEMEGEIVNITNKVLRDDITYQLSSGKEVKFTPRVKGLVLKQKNLLADKGFLERGFKYAGKCLACGRSIASGDIALVEVYDETNCMCFNCLDSKNTLSENGAFKLIEA